MADNSAIIANACVIIEGIAFEVVNNSETKVILASDLYNSDYKASFIVHERDIVLSVSSFREQLREQALMEAVRINNHLLVDEVLNA